MKFELEYVRCVRNEEEFVCSAPNCCDMEQRSASQHVSCLTHLSADLSVIWLRVPDYFLWGYLKGRVYQNKPRTIGALKANVIEEIHTVTAEVLARTFHNMARRVQSCLNANDGYFQHML